MEKKGYNFFRILLFVVICIICMGWFYGKIFIPRKESHNDNAKNCTKVINESYALSSAINSFYKIPANSKISLPDLSMLEYEHNPEYEVQIYGNDHKDIIIYVDDLYHRCPKGTFIQIYPKEGPWRKGWVANPNNSKK